MLSYGKCHASQANFLFTVFVKYLFVVVVGKDYYKQSKRQLYKYCNHLKFILYNSLTIVNRLCRILLPTP